MCFYYMYHSQNCQVGQLAKPNITSIFSENNAFYIASTCHTKWIFTKTILISVTLLQNGICFHLQFCINPPALGHCLTFLTPSWILTGATDPAGKKGFVMCLLSQPLLQIPDGRLHRKDSLGREVLLNGLSTNTVSPQKPQLPPSSMVG